MESADSAAAVSEYTPTIDFVSGSWLLKPKILSPTPSFSVTGLASNPMVFLLCRYMFKLHFRSSIDAEAEQASGMKSKLATIYGISIFMG
jgi:hypothetical protein